MIGIFFNSKKESNLKINDRIMNSTKIIYEIKDNAAFITLNNPTKLNCIGFQMLYELEEALVKIEKDNEVRVVVFRGSGDRAFSTGADLKEFGFVNQSTQPLA